MRSLIESRPSVANLLFDFRWPGYKPVDFYKEDEALVIRLEPRERYALCPHCGSRCFKRHGAQIRRAVDAPFFPHQRLIIEYLAQRYRCSCGHTCTEQPTFIKPRAKITNAMVLYAQQLLRVPSQTMLDVSKLTGLNSKTLRRLDKEQLKFCYENINLNGVRNIAIDEFSIFKGHKYATVVIDNDNCQVIWVGKGKSRACVQPFFDLLKAKGVALNIRSVACDQNAAYPSLVRENLPNATIVYDMFHVLANWRRLVLKEARIQTLKQTTERMQKEAIEEAQALGIKVDKAALRFNIQQTVSAYNGVDWMMVIPQENLTKTKEEKLLTALNQDNALLAALYPITESLRTLWTSKDREESKRMLMTLVALLRQIGRTFHFKPAMSFALMLMRRYDGIVKAGHFGYSTSRLEGVNNRIKVLKRTAFGYRDMEYFFLKIKSVLSGKRSIPMFQKLDGIAIIGGVMWSGAWKTDFMCCNHAQVL